MITKQQTVRFYVGADEFTSLQGAQMRELKDLLNVDEGTALTILSKRDKIVDILTTTETSLAKARKINGGRKPRKVKATATTEDKQPALPREDSKGGCCDMTHDCDKMIGSQQ